MDKSFALTKELKKIKSNLKQIVTKLVSENCQSNNEKEKKLAYLYDEASKRCSFRSCYNLFSLQKE